VCQLVGATARQVMSCSCKRFQAVVAYGNAQDAFAKDEEQEAVVEVEAGEDGNASTSDEEREALPGDELLQRSDQSASGFKGVTAETGGGWVARISYGRRQRIGKYDSALEAARARRDYLANVGNSEDEEADEGASENEVSLSRRDREEPKRFLPQDWMEDSDAEETEAHIAAMGDGVNVEFNGRQ